MDFLDIAKTVGAGVFSALVPGGSSILTAVNAVLPDEHKLLSNSTGSQIVKAVGNLPPELQAQVALKKFDVDIEQIKQSHETVRAMLVADATNPQSTRPKIALKSFYVLAIVTIIIVLIFGYAVVTGDGLMVKAIMEGWPLILTLTGTYTTLLYAYFGILRKENDSKLNASNGHEAGVSALGKLIAKAIK